MVAAWRAVIRSLFADAVDGDLLRLVHLTNGFRVLNHAGLRQVPSRAPDMAHRVAVAQPIPPCCSVCVVLHPSQEGDKIACRARIRAVMPSDTGKRIEVAGRLSVGDQEVMEVTSAFFIRGDFGNDFAAAFQERDEPSMRVRPARPPRCAGSDPRPQRAAVADRAPRIGRCCRTSRSGSWC